MALRCKRCETGEWLAVGRHRQSRNQSPIQAGVHGRAGLVSLDVTSVQGDSSGFEPHSAEFGRAAADRLFFELVAEERGVPVLPRPLGGHAHRQEGRALRHWQAFLPGRFDRSVYRCNDCSV